MPNEEKELQQLVEEDGDAIKELWKKLVVDDVENVIKKGITSIDQKIASLPKDEDITPSKKEITEIKNISKDIKENCSNIDAKQEKIIKKSTSIDKTVSDFNSNIDKKHKNFENKFHQLSNQNLENKKYLTTLLRKQNKIPAYFSDLKRLNNILIRTQNDVYKQNSVLQQNINSLSVDVTKSKIFNKNFKENVFQEITDIQTKLENQNTQYNTLLKKINSLFEKQNKSINLSKELKEFINTNKDEIESKIIKMPEMQNALSNSVQEIRTDNKEIFKESRINLFLYILISVSSINLVFNICQIFGLF